MIKLKDILLEKEQIVQPKDISQLKKTNVNIAEGHMVQRRDLKNHFKHGGKDPVDMLGNPKPVYKKVIALNSKFRDDYYGTLSTDYLTTLPTKLKEVVSMELSGFEFPNTYFQISYLLKVAKKGLGSFQGLCLLL